MQKAPSLLLTLDVSGTHDAKYTFRRCRGGDSFRDSAKSAEAVITKQCQEEWDSGTDSCCRLQLVEKDGHAVTLWPQISPPTPKNGEQKQTPFISHLFYSLSFGLKEQFIPPFFCFTSGFVRVPQSPSQHNVRVWNPGEGQWELDVTLIQLRFITQTGPQLDVVFGKAKKLDCLCTVYSALTVWVKLGFSSAC